MLIDSHVHIGQFYDLCVEADMLASFMRSVGASRYAVASTSICENDYIKVLDEFHRLIEMDGERVLPILWVTSKMLADDKEACFIDSDIRWKIIKIHPGLEGEYWKKERAVMDYVVDIAMDLKLPILMHTGLEDGARAGELMDIVERHHVQTFILAHGRPLNETAVLLSRYDNVMVDTAFMPADDIACLVSANFEDRILWGSDSCIIKRFYPNIDLVGNYAQRLKEIRTIVSDAVFDKITYRNASRMFNL